VVHGGLGRSEIDRPLAVQRGVVVDHDLARPAVAAYAPPALRARRGTQQGVRGGGGRGQGRQAQEFTPGGIVVGLRLVETGRHLASSVGVPPGSRAGG